jgi:hypothetical protein
MLVKEQNPVAMEGTGEGIDALRLELGRLGERIGPPV